MTLWCTKGHQILNIAHVWSFTFVCSQINILHYLSKYLSHSCFSMFVPPGCLHITFIYGYNTSPCYRFMYVNLGYYHSTVRPSEPYPPCGGSWLYNMAACTFSTCCVRVVRCLNMCPTPLKACHLQQASTCYRLLWCGHLLLHLHM